MNSTKYIGMDVHKETISIAVMDFAGKRVMESILETKAITILQFIQGLRGNLEVTFEEGTWAAWLFDALGYGRLSPKISIRHVGQLGELRMMLPMQFPQSVHSSELRAEIQEPLLPLTPESRPAAEGT
jgi:hypothetical protein